MCSCDCLCKFVDIPFSHVQDGEVPLLAYQCMSAASNIWIPVLLVIKSLYLVVGVFLATQTYNVKLKRLRDSKLIVACVCTTVVVALVATIVGLSVNDSSVAYGVYGFCILSMVTVILFTLFGTLVSIVLYENTCTLISVFPKATHACKNKHANRTCTLCSTYVYSSKATLSLLTPPLHYIIIVPPPHIHLTPTYPTTR